MKRPIFPAVLGLALYFAVAGGEYSMLEARRAEAALASRQAELPVMRRQIDSLYAWIDSLQHSDEALERFARERYGFIRDGEYLYRISENKAEEGQTEPARTSILGRLRGDDRPGGSR